MSRSRCAAPAADEVALRRLIATAIFVGAAALHGGAQAPVRGRVVDDETGAPIRNARVAFDLKMDPSAVLSDAEGRFTLPATGSGSQTLYASKAGYSARATRLAGGVEIRLRRGAVITGRVLDDFGEPLALIRVAAEQVSRVNGRLEFTRHLAVDTDDAGSYRIFGLPAGEFVVGLAGPRIMLGNTSATPMPGPLDPTAALRSYYPDAKSRDEAQAIVVRAGEEVAGINFTMETPHAFSSPVAQPPSTAAASPTTGTIQGHVVHTGGLPVRRARVMVLRADRTFAESPAFADDDGHYEVSGLRPGAYRVVATDTSFRTAEHGQRLMSDHGDLVTVRAGGSADGVDVVIPRGNAVSGRIVDEYGDPIENANVRVERIGWSRGRPRLASVGGTAARQTDDRGRFRIFGLTPGRYVLGAVVGEPVPGWETADIPGYLRTYFPGSSAAVEAQLVEVTDDADALNTEFALVRGRPARLTGRAFRASGAPFDGAVWLNQSARSGAVTTPPVSQRTRADGSFEFTRLAPGEYVIQAATSREGTAVEGEFGATFVPVGGDDVTDAVIRMSAGSSITGRVTFEGRSPPDDAGAVGISAGVPVEVDLRSLADNPAAYTSARDDGTWELAGLSGSRRLRVTNAPSGWALDRIMMNGVDVTDAAVSFGAKEESARDVEVVLTDRVTMLEGIVHDSRDQPSVGATVLAFSTDRALWYAESRFVRMEGTVNGTVAVAALPPGQYFVAAIEGSATTLLEDRLDDRIFLESLVPDATRVTLEAGQRATVSVRTR